MNQDDPFNDDDDDDKFDWIDWLVFIFAALLLLGAACFIFGKPLYNLI